MLCFTTKIEKGQIMFSKIGHNLFYLIFFFFELEIKSDFEDDK